MWGDPLKRHQVIHKYQPESHDGQSYYNGRI